MVTLKKKLTWNNPKGLLSMDKKRKSASLLNYYMI